jgi:carboxyl-terminal processing protease
MSALMLFLAEVAAKGTAVLALALVLNLCLRRAAAATRHLVWTGALLGALALPALTLLEPRWCVLVITSPTTAAAPPVEALAPEGAIAVAQLKPAPSPLVDLPAGRPSTVASDVIELAPPVAAPPPTVVAPSAPLLSLSFEARLAIVWAAGLGVSLAVIALALIRLNFLSQRCTLLSDGPIVELATQLARDMRIRRPIRVVTTPARTIPMTWGLFRPTLLLPVEASDWTTDRLRMVLLHELGHIARWDCATHLFGTLARCLYWFHPLAWWALAKQRQEQEKACDDLVVTHGAPAQDYAEHLLAVTAHLPAGYFAPSLALGMARTSRLRERLVALLDAKRTRRPTLTGKLFAAGIVAFSLVAPAASIQCAVAQAVAAEDERPAADLPGPMTPDTLKQLEEIRKKLRDHYVKPIDERELTNAAIKGLLQGLKDPYTDYVTADELNMVQNQTQGAFVGIGAQLKVINERLTVLTPIDHSPALKAGIRPGDIIEAIDGQSTRGLEVCKAGARIMGKAGTVVKLKVVHNDGVVEELAVTRGPIRIASVQGFLREPEGAWRFMLDGEHKIGYVHITQFSSATAKETRTAIQELQKNGLKALILDLRACPGGLLDQALSVCKLFIAQGQLLTVKGAGKSVSSFQADGKNTLGDFPMAVLINEETASAAEIVAGALNDHARAVLVGTRTFGKGSVQEIVKLDDGGALKVTTSYYFLPNGRNIQKRPGEMSWGVNPTDGYFLPLTKAQADAVKKVMMDRAVLGYAKDEQPPPPARITPKMLEDKFADPQLAGALRTLVARLTGGEFLKVGQTNAVLQEHLQRLEEMRQRRETLLQNLQQLERDIDALQQGSGPKK